MTNFLLNTLYISKFYDYIVSIFFKRERESISVRQSTKTLFLLVFLLLWHTHKHIRHCCCWSHKNTTNCSRLKSLAFFSFLFLYYNQISEFYVLLSFFVEVPYFARSLFLKKKLLKRGARTFPSFSLSLS